MTRGDTVSKLHSIGLFLFVFAASFSLFHCATVRAVGPKVIHMAAEDCVELSSGTVKQVCATVDELAPFLEAIMSARQSAAKKSLLDAGTD